MNFHIFIPYDSVESLIEQFKIEKVNFRPVAYPNFVLIDPKNYHGTYGGLVYKSVLEKCASSDYISSSIDSNTALVWWNSYHPQYMGDQHALSVHNRVAVTPFIFDKLIINPLRKRNRGRSSYYGERAWSINS